MIEIKEGLEWVDFETVAAWLASSYWSPGISQTKVEKAAEGASLVIGVYDGEIQAGYCRVVSDRETFAWLCDVFVNPDYRGQGLATKMVAYALEHPDHQGLRRWMLATRDAHAVYEKLGFESVPIPEHMMVLVPKAPAA
ncbi:N-acetyltransferase [bacterium]|nr:MAG: N-acetyltransferase [bacterium]